MNGKGSRRRPCQIPHDEFARNWEQCFGKKDERDDDETDSDDQEEENEQDC